jgi:hypothetical protein
MKKICVLLISVILLGACGLTREDLGMTRSVPDETKVVKKNKSLTLPPDYSVLPK